MTSFQQQTTTQVKFLDPKTRIAESYYGFLGVSPIADPMDIRRSYLELSKKYHPDTTELPIAEATIKFQQLNEAYATLSNIERRSLYDLKIGFSRHNVLQPLANLHQTSPQYAPHESRSAYIDASDRPLSAGEIFVLLILGGTLLGCLGLVILLCISRGDTSLQNIF